MALQSGFSNQGTLDWLTLAKTPVNISLDVLSRYSKAGVDPSSVMAGQIVCSFIVMTPKTEKQVLQHLTKLPQVAMYGKVAKFGFGLQHVLEDLVQLNGGVSCLALCGCLTHSYDLFFGARVLRALCVRQKMPVELMPGVMQWKALLEPCNKIFSGSRFARYVDEGFTPLLLDRDMNTGRCRLEATDPEELASAIILLANVASRRLESCVIRGGIDCAWLAAVAIFVFDLTVRIQTADGDDLYRSSSAAGGPANDAQITIVKHTSSASKSIEVARRTFVLSTGQDLLAKRPNEPGVTHRFFARSTWDSIIADAFGTNIAERILSGPASEHFAAFLVYLAYRQETLLGQPLEDDLPAAESDGSTVDQRLWPPENPERKSLGFYTWPHLRHTPRSPSGADLLAFAAKCFPALRPCLDVAKLKYGGREMSRKAAKAHFEAFGRTCGCDSCKSGYASTGAASNRCICQCALVIVHWIRILSTARVHDVLPTPGGFDQMSPDVKLWDSKPSRGMGDGRISFLSKLFTGDEANVNKIGKPLMALSSRGTCLFMGILMDPSLGPDEAGVIHVVPGQLEHDGHVFQVVYQHTMLKSVLDTQLWSEFDLNPERRFVLAVSDLLVDGVLEVSYRTDQSSSVGPFRAFELDLVIDLALSYTNNFPTRGAGSVEVYWLIEVGQKFSTRKTPWNLNLLAGSGPRAPQESMDRAQNHDISDNATTATTATNNLSSATDLVRSRDHHNRHHHQDDPSTSNSYSLLIILSPDDHSTLEIHKSSLRERGSAIGLEQYYAEFARDFSELPDHRNIQRDIVPGLPDCPRCIVHYVLRVWTRYVSPSMKLISGQIYIHRSGTDFDVVPFELNRCKDDELPDQMKKGAREVTIDKSDATHIGWLWWWWWAIWLSGFLFSLLNGC
ncbi:MAG: hypothetical protein M1823_004429 [Watsoniomyces obsoletus]|nr:MAG: hypothetical protein M1823_004429 [Watsoniomyces obsoletus]